MEDTDEHRSTGGEAGTPYSGLSRQLDRGESISSCCPCREKNSVGTSDGKLGRLLLLLVLFLKLNRLYYGQYAPCF